MWADEEKREKGTRVEAIWYRAEAWEEVRLFFRDTLALREVGVNPEEGEAEFSTDAGPAVYLLRGKTAQPRESPVVGLRFAELETLHARLIAAGTEAEVRRGKAGITRLRFSDPEGGVGSIKALIGPPSGDSDDSDRFCLSDASLVRGPHTHGTGIGEETEGNG